MLEKTFSYGYEKWNFHLRSLLTWHRYEQIVDDVLRLSSQGFVADVGCGFGQITEMLHLKGIGVVGIDIGGETGENKVWKHLQAPFILGDGCNLPIEKGMFDAVVCCGVLEHVYNQPKFLKECRRILKNSGLFLCYYLPNRTGVESLFSRVLYTDHIFFEKSKIECLFRECGYDVLTVAREHVIFEPRQFGRAQELWNRLGKSLALLDDTLTKTPLKFFGDNWRVVAKKGSSMGESSID
jgi:ubiquinone/menaquinone biosynthesis C-methylase UbiE